MTDPLGEIVKRLRIAQGLAPQAIKAEKPTAPSEGLSGVADLPVVDRKLLRIKPALDAIGKVMSQEAIEQAKRAYEPKRFAKVPARRKSKGDCDG